MSDNDIEFEYNKLPQPPFLRQSLLVEFSCRGALRMICFAGAIRNEPWEKGEIVTWLHAKGVQVTDQIPSGDVANAIAMLIPVSHITAISLGPTYTITKHHKSDDIGVFPPYEPFPANPVDPQLVRKIVGELTHPEQN